MTAPVNVKDFATPVINTVDYKESGHARFTQIQCILSGTHPDVQVGQVWEDLDPRREGRHILVTSVNDDGTASVQNIFVGRGSKKNLGNCTELATYRFRIDGDNKGYRLRAALAFLDDAGNPIGAYEAPEVITLSDMVYPDPAPVVKKVATTTSTKNNVTKPTADPKSTNQVVSTVPKAASDIIKDIKDGNSASKELITTPLFKMPVSTSEIKQTPQKAVNPQHLTRIASEVAGSIDGVDNVVNEFHIGTAKVILGQMSVGPAVVFARSLLKEDDFPIFDPSDSETFIAFLRSVEKRAADWLSTNKVQIHA